MAGSSYVQFWGTIPTRFGVFMAVKIYIMVFCIVALCRVVVGY